MIYSLLALVLVCGGVVAEKAQLSQDALQEHANGMQGKMAEVLASLKEGKLDMAGKAEAVAAFAHKVASAKSADALQDVMDAEEKHWTTIKQKTGLDIKNLKAQNLDRAVLAKLAAMVEEYGNSKVKAHDETDEAKAALLEILEELIATIKETLGVPSICDFHGVLDKETKSQTKAKPKPAALKIKSLDTTSVPSEEEIMERVRELCKEWNGMTAQLTVGVMACLDTCISYGGGVTADLYNDEQFVHMVEGAGVTTGIEPGTAAAFVNEAFYSQNATECFGDFKVAGLVTGDEVSVDLIFNEDWSALLGVGKTTGFASWGAFPIKINYYDLMVEMVGILDSRETLHPPAKKGKEVKAHAAASGAEEQAAQKSVPKTGKSATKKAAPTVRWYWVVCGVFAVLVMAAFTATLYKSAQAMKGKYVDSDTQPLIETRRLVM